MIGLSVNSDAGSAIPDRQSAGRAIDSSSSGHNNSIDRKIYKRVSCSPDYSLYFIPNMTYVVTLVYPNWIYLRLFFKPLSDDRFSFAIGKWSSDG
jgi:hypothetical protein